MPITIDSIEEHSIAQRHGLQPKDKLLSINGNEIHDGLDYRFYMTEAALSIDILSKNGPKTVHIKKDEYEDIGLLFDTYLIDKERSCANNCIFCFVDQMPKGLRKSLYFKDDDSRLSFLFGNYITLTNLSKRDVERIVKMRISPINISVHTTDHELRCQMMGHRKAGESLWILQAFFDAGIQMNAQIVACPGYNDGEALSKTLNDLLAYYPVMESVAVVPVGLTRYRENLPHIEGFNKESAEKVLEIVESFGEMCYKEKGSRFAFCADEFYCKAGRPIPDEDYYEDMSQLDNGVGLWALFHSEFVNALEEVLPPGEERKVSLITGVAAYPLLSQLVSMAEEAWPGFSCKVYPVSNDFFGHTIDVAGLITGRDVLAQLADKPLYEELLLPAVMLRSEQDMFLDDVTLTELEETLGVPCTPVPIDGYEFAEALRERRA